MTLEPPRHTSAEAPGSDTQFGWVFTAFFSLVGAWPLFYGNAPRLWALALAVSFAECTLIQPSLLAPLNRLWFRFGLLLQRIVSPVMLLAMYIITIVPLGLAMRLAGRDPLKRRFEPDASTYWVARTPPGKPDDSMKNQF